MNLRQLLQSFRELQHDLYEEEEVSAIFFLSVQHISGLSRTEVKLDWDRVFSEQEEGAYRKVIDELRGGRPIQHILGETVFYGLKMKVDASVLIPRPETEELVDWILSTIKSPSFRKNEDKLGIADFGTGSGCIAISLKVHLPAAEIDAIDLSADALKTAAENAAINSALVHFINADMREYQSEKKYTVIVSNPPYIRNIEKEEMHPNVLEHEPHIALFVPDEQPLIYYKTIAELALKQLKREGYLFFEINEHLAEETIDMLRSKSFVTIELRKDMQGKDRMIMARLI